jgi:cell wall-associated NlpC family hydrolase
VKKIPLLTGFLILFMFISVASAKTTYTIKKGDNLYDIAKKYHVSPKAIEKANKVSAKSLKPGTRIVIPSTGAASKKSRRTDTQEAASHDSSPAAHEPSENGISPSSHASAEPSTYHTVRKGDSMKSVARKYGVSVSDIKALNGLKSSKLRTGQKLLVKRSGPKTYVVRKGDNLSKIAKKFDMDADDLMEINEMSSPSVTAGQRLYLEEKPDVVNVDQKYLVMANTLEEEMRKVSESPAFAELTTQDKLVIFARKLLNIPYKFGGNTILGIDCSAYVKKVYGMLGVDLPRTAREQFNEGQEIEKEELSIGDLVFFKTYASFPSHVGIYLGNNLFIHASSKGKKVTINSLDTPYYLKRFIGAKRLISAPDSDRITSTEPAS